MQLIKGKRGAALMQVLLITAVLAGIATFILRASLSRTSNARRTRRTVMAHMLIGSCMSEVNALWAAKKPEAFFRDMDQCIMYCNDSSSDFSQPCSESKKKTDYVCTVEDPSVELDGGAHPTYKVTALMTTKGSGATQECEISYTVAGNEAAHSKL